MLRFFPIIFLSLFIGSQGLSAQTQGPSASGNSVSKVPLLILAERLGRAAGNAEYCHYDADAIEDFIARAMARLAKETEDRVLLAGGRVEFNAHAAFGRSEGPDQGCEMFAMDYADMKRTLLY